MVLQALVVLVDLVLGMAGQVEHLLLVLLDL
jgi:hypothetical protein